MLKLSALVQNDQNKKKREKTGDRRFNDNDSRT